MMIQLTSGFCAGPGDKSKMGFRSPRLAKSHWAAYLSPWSRAGAPEPLEKDAFLSGYPPEGPVEDALLKAAEVALVLLPVVIRVTGEDLMP